MKILVVLRNLYNNPDLFDEEQYLCKSDQNILSEAVMLREEYGGDITAVLFAEDVEDSEMALKKACAYGADNVFHVVLDQVDFSDTSTFSRVISRTVGQYFKEFDLLLFGRVAYDGDAANIATQTADRLKIPAVVYSKEIGKWEERNIKKTPQTDKGKAQQIDKKNATDKSIKVQKMVSNWEDIVYRLTLPALVQSIREKNLTRQLNIADIIRTYSEVEVKKIDGDEIVRKVGANQGRIISDRKRKLKDDTYKEIQFLNGMSDKESATNLIKLLKKLGFEGNSFSLYHFFGRYPYLCEGKTNSVEKEGEMTCYYPMRKENFKEKIDMSKLAYVETIAKKEQPIPLKDAQMIMAGGRGLLNQDSFLELRKLAKIYGASVGASRPVVDQGWAEVEEQIGQTGNFVRPKVYLAFGISGAVQHLAGMKDSQVIIAINQNKNSLIFQYCDYGILADANSIIRNMIQISGENGELSGDMNIK